MNRLNQVKGMTQMSNQINQKRSILLIFMGYFESIQMVQSYQSLKVNQLSHLLYENELTQSPINSLGKGTESTQSILRKNEFVSKQSTQSS